MAERIAIYPGTFDPLTNGHVSIVRRSLDIFDKVIVAVAVHSGKNPLFSLDERVEMVREVFQQNPRVIAESFSGLLVEYAQSRGVNTIIRGLRAVSDFEYEFQMALMNRKLEPNIHTVFMMTDYKWLYISSTIIKDVARLGGSIEGLVPAVVAGRMRERLAATA
ncbi:MAG: pantetheine-phosphate adenylyltransferase [Desulfomicrobiaceae bacterium]|jgi:pantetheine-phosphate adenylyltransferase|nr:pantetheine-phosphate adenylyltransferase [Desulfomicrobiaceae bacterium]MBZ4685169.1 pantetheine-phosphate adenylyltransferase [Desulfomicrobiaceae bacterium]MDI3492140.1 pantetheine-phosphate adenylyltransferase [Desulfomicrobiaceae bacterium]MDK2872485.1 pantetheine-phosphate adenylyltransferase [Desulfomicrobiaceae bacterium]HCF05888.1 pantetheine-phosphate adenylyltransferase [Desulfomicrobiaceae bacterium]